MQTSSKYEAYLSSLSAKQVRGEGYEIKIYSPWAIRYQEGDRTLTLGSEVHVKEDAHRKKIWFLGVYLETPLAWDNEMQGEIISPEKAALIVSRVEGALREKGERYEIMPTRTE